MSNTLEITTKKQKLEKSDDDNEEILDCGCIEPVEKTQQLTQVFLCIYDRTIFTTILDEITKEYCTNIFSIILEYLPRETIMAMLSANKLLFKRVYHIKARDIFTHATFFLKEQNTSLIDPLLEKQFVKNLYINTIELPLNFLKPFNNLEKLKMDVDTYTTYGKRTTEYNEQRYKNGEINSVTPIVLPYSNIRGLTLILLSEPVYGGHSHKNHEIAKEIPRQFIPRTTVKLVVCNHPEKQRGIVTFKGKMPNLSMLKNVKCTEHLRIIGLFPNFGRLLRKLTITRTSAREITLPHDLNKLKIIDSFRSSIRNFRNCKDVLPFSHLTTLKHYDCRHKIERLPQTLTKLVLIVDNFRGSFGDTSIDVFLSMLPLELTHLSLSGCCELTSTLKFLEMRELKYLQLNNIFIKIDYPLIFPESIEELLMCPYDYQGHNTPETYTIVLPPNLKVFEFKSCKRLIFDNMPDSIREMNLQTYTRGITKFPKNLKKLKSVCLYSQAMLPEGIEDITIYNIEPCCDRKLPSSLKRLKVDILRKELFDRLPDSLNTLIVNDMIELTEYKNFPSALETFSLRDRRTLTQLKFDFTKSNIKSICYNIPLYTNITIPHTLTRLEVYEEISVDNNFDIGYLKWITNDFPNLESVYGFNDRREVTTILENNVLNVPQCYYWPELTVRDTITEIHFKKYCEFWGVVNIPKSLKKLVLPLSYKDSMLKKLINDNPHVEIYKWV